MKAENEASEEGKACCGTSQGSPSAAQPISGPQGSRSRAPVAPLPAPASPTSLLPRKQELLGGNFQVVEEHKMPTDFSNVGVNKLGKHSHHQSLANWVSLAHLTFHRHWLERYTAVILASNSKFIGYKINTVSTWTQSKKKHHTLIPQSAHSGV